MSGGGLADRRPETVVAWLCFGENANFDPRIPRAVQTLFEVLAAATTEPAETYTTAFSLSTGGAADGLVVNPFFGPSSNEALAATGAPPGTTAVAAIDFGAAPGVTAADVDAINKLIEGLFGACMPPRREPLLVTGLWMAGAVSRTMASRQSIVSCPSLLLLQAGSPAPSWTSI